MACADAQEEEKEVLESIYGDDKCFNAVSSNVFQYRIGELGDEKSFLLEVQWVEHYPEAPPTINLESFFNKHLNKESKKRITEALLKEANELLASPMTYSLFEYARDNVDDLIVVTKEQAPPTESAKYENKPEDVASPTAKPKVKKEVLSKAAKRRRAGRLMNADGEQPRGWNWVDIIKHLSKTGSQ